MTKPSPSVESNDSKAAFEGKYLYAVGKRKSSIARVKLYMTGKGDIVVNGKNYEQVLGFTADMKYAIVSPFQVLGMKKEYSVDAKVYGGGKRGQSDALRHGIAKALVLLDPENKKTLRKAGFVTRDPRVKERRKPGLKKARRAPQWAKR
ncbi:MAG: 30S ribosomal protein S9 [Parcubacteria group bacterium]|nr:30S ribosomal protein S9 [Parcubacteria group bacterium]